MKLFDKIKKFIQPTKKYKTDYITKPLSLLQPCDIVYVLAVNKYNLQYTHSYLYELTEPKNLWVRKAYVKQIHKFQRFEDEMIFQILPITKKEREEELIIYTKDTDFLFKTIHTFTTWKYRGYTIYIATNKKQLEKEINKLVKIIKKLYKHKYENSNKLKYEITTHTKIMKQQMAQLKFKLNSL